MEGTTLAVGMDSTSNHVGGTMNRTGRTIGAAIGAVIFMLFFAELADRLVAQERGTVYTVSAPQPSR